MTARKVVVGAIVIVLFGAWYAFRPEGLFIDRPVEEAMPVEKAGTPLRVVARGVFRGVAHPTNGTATVYQASDGSRVLRFSQFKTTNGPNVHVYIVGADNPTDKASVQKAGFVDLGSIKGNVGDQNYSIGPEVDLSKYRAVSVWCKRFSINFGVAPLTPGGATSQK